MTVIKDNIGEIESLAKFVLEDLRANKFKIDYCVAIGRAKELRSLLDINDILKLSQIIHNIANKYLGKIHISLPPVLTGPNIFSSPCRYRELISVLPNGDVSLCGIGITHKELVFGNIRRKSLTEIWQSSKPLKRLQNVNYKDFKGVCNICIFRKYCANFCPAYAYEVYGDLLAPFPICQELYEKGLFPQKYIRQV